MKSSLLIIFIANILITIYSAVIYVPGIAVDPLLIYKIQVCCDRLQNDLITTYGTQYESAIRYYG